MEVLKDILDSFPMLRSSTGVEAAENSHCIGNVWSSAHSKVHETAHSTEVGHMFHVLNFFQSFGGHVLGKVDVWVKRSGNRMGIGLVKAFKDVFQMLLL
jgi:hypothetical protein